MKTTACFATLVLSVFAATATDWPNFRGPTYDGISQETGWTADWPADGPKTLWKAKVGMGFATIAVANGRAYTTGNTRDVDTVFCFDANNGTSLWKHSYAAKLDPKYYEGGTSATPTVDGNRVYTVSKRGVIHCLDAANGNVIWTTNLMEALNVKMPTWGFAGSVLIEGDLAILNFGAAGTALDKKTGKVIWTSGPEEAGYSTPVPFAAGSERAVLLATKQDVVAVKVKDGQELWRIPWSTHYDVNAADPILVGSKVFISSGYNHGGGVFEVSAQPPKKIWQNQELRTHIANSIYWQGHIYGIDASGPKDGQLRCVNFETGEVKWTEKSTAKGALMLAGGKLIVLSERGELMVAPPSPEGFKPVARAQVIGGKCWSAPVLANGKIYCRAGAGDVVCVDVSGK